MAPEEKEGGGKRRILLPIFALLAIAGLVYFGKGYMYRRVHETTDNAQVDGHIVPVLAKVSGYVTAVNVAVPAVFAVTV